jgi:hypothetical protein
MEGGPGGDFWSVILIGGPALLVAVMIYVWLSNRSAVQKRGGNEGAALGTTNAVEGSPNARPDLARDEARAKAGESVSERAGSAEAADGGSGADGGGGD